MNILDLKHELLDAGLDDVEAPTDFAACLNALGLYNSMQFVLRLSPRIHALMDSIPNGQYDRASISGEAIQAYSTYLHETIHWWQHIGSTSGLVLSLCYPGQTHVSMQQLINVIAAIGPKKSLFKWAETQLLAGVPTLDPVLSQANTAVNNALDVEFYKTFTMMPERAEVLFAHQYFESVGHCYHIAYACTLNLLADFDPNFERMPNQERWEVEFGKLGAAKHIGFYCGSPIVRPPVGLRALYEGQARFIQLQFLTFTTDITCDELKKSGYFKDIYGVAFDKFLELTKAEWPAKIDSPEVALFLLICDLSINPTRGFPFDIGSFKDFILDVDPGTRFAVLCKAVNEKRRDLLNAIKHYSFQEYVEVSNALCEATGYDHPMAALEEISEWPDHLPKVAEIMKERETFNYLRLNLPLRLIYSHFIGFCRDKYEHPEFFCWTGAWMTGVRASKQTEDLFLRHLSLYSDRGDDDGIFARRFPDKDPEGIMRTYNSFYAGLMTYDLTRQWVLQDGPFKYDYSWLTQRRSNEDMAGGVKKIFEHLFGSNPDSFEIL